MSDPLEDRIYRDIKESIKSLKLRPGQKISYTDWADKHDTSRTPVRDALKRLELEGLVVRENGRVWRVYTLTLEDVVKIHDAREGIEGSIARLAARNLTDAQATRLRELVAQMEQACLVQDRESFRRADREFHAIMNTAADNKYLLEAYESMDTLLARLRGQNISIEGRIARTYRENARIAEALIAHDEDAAECAQRDHLRASRDNLMTILEQMIVPYVGNQF
jgi:DNA-binding GntR family transcriptional regulator